MLKTALRVKTVHFPCFTVLSQQCSQSDWVAGRRDHLSVPQTDFNLLQCYAPPKQQSISDRLAFPLFEYSTRSAEPHCVPLFWFSHVILTDDRSASGTQCGAQIRI